MLTTSALEIHYTVNDLEKVAKQLLVEAPGKTILFFGDMGVGKTTLIKAIVKALGSEDTVSSPTYSIVNEYKAKDDYIYHFDFYRVQSLEEAYDFGIEDYIDSEHWSLIEWPEIIKELLPKNALRVFLETHENNERKVTFSRPNLTLKT